jgi:acyl-CoA thioester hydrolase
MDAQGHINNAFYLDYLQEARVDFLLTGPSVMSDLLATGVLVVSHQVEYLRPLEFSLEPLTVELWIDSVGASRFVVGYDLHTDVLVARARTAAVPYDLAGSGLRRLRPDERAVFLAAREASPPLRSVAKGPLDDHAHRFPLRVRWSDLDSYGHVNNVKFFDYVQEARIALMGETVGWSGGEVWVVVRQDLEYLRPLDFRLEPYVVRTAVSAIGTRSFTLAVQLEDPETATVYAAARTVVVGDRQLSDVERKALARRQG